MTKPPNIILLVADSLRADHLACYGYSRDTTPHLDQFAAAGAQVDRMLCAGMPTQPSFTTMFTGRHPIQHRIVAHGGKAVLGDDVMVLAEQLLAGGYDTCAVDSLVREREWLGRGFEHYIDPSLHYKLTYLLTAEEINRRIIEWVQVKRNRPFFLLAHYWDVHYPYVPPISMTDRFYSGDPCAPGNGSLEAAWRQPVPAMARETWLRTPNGPVTDVEYVRALYDGAIRYLDEHTGMLLRELDRYTDPENTLVIFTADHGESIDEHGIYIEHFGLYDCTIRVPFLARWPGTIPAGLRVSGLLDHTRLAATLLQAARLSPGAGQGASFLDSLMGFSDASQPFVVSAECSWQAKWSLTRGDYKLILSRFPDSLGNPLRELYDIRRDRGERVNIADTQRGVADDMEAALEDWLTRQLRASGFEQDPLIEEGISLGDVLAQG